MISNINNKSAQGVPVMKILCKSNQMDLHHLPSPLYKNKIGDISFQKGYNQNLANLVILECAIQFIPCVYLL